MNVRVACVPTLTFNDDSLQLILGAGLCANEGSGGGNCVLRRKRCLSSVLSSILPALAVSLSLPALS